MNKIIDCIKRSPNYNQSELDFIQSRFTGKELSIQLIDLSTDLLSRDIAELQAVDADEVDWKKFWERVK